MPAVGKCAVLHGGAQGDVLDPVPMLQIPPYGAEDAVFETDAREPPKVPADLFCIQRIPPVMARAILDEADLRHAPSDGSSGF